MILRFIKRQVLKSEIALRCKLIFGFHMIERVMFLKRDKNIWKILRII